MIRQKISIEIDWDILDKDQKLFERVQNSIISDALKDFSGIYQAKVTTGGRVVLTVFKPSDTMKKNMARIKKMVAMKKKKLK